MPKLRHADDGWLRLCGGGGGGSCGGGGGGHVRGPRFLTFLMIVTFCNEFDDAND